MKKIILAICAYFILASVAVAGPWYVDNNGYAHYKGMVSAGQGYDIGAYIAKGQTIANADSDAQSAGVGLTCSTGITISTAVTITSPMRAEKGCLFTKSGSGTIAFSGSFEAGDYQVFSGFSAGDVTFAAGSVTGIRLQWFGGLGDDATDCTSAFVQANGSAKAGVVSYGAKQNILLSAGVYRVTATSGNYAVTANVPIVGEGPSVSVIKNVGTGSALKIEGITGEIYYSRWRNFSVVGNASSEDGIVLNIGADVNKAVGYSKFDNVDSSWHGRHGLVHRASWGTKYDTCKFHHNGGLGVYLQADEAGHRHNNIIFTNCDSRWNGGTGNAGTDYLKGGVRISGGGIGIYWTGGVVESNNAWAFIIGQHPSGGTAFAKLIKINNVYIEDTPTTSGTSVTGGGFHLSSRYANVEVDNSLISYVAPAGGTGYGFLVANLPENGIAIRQSNNIIESSGTGTSVDVDGVMSSIGIPAFSAYQDGNILNATGAGTAVDIPFNTSVFSQNNNFNNTTGIFTAPVSGRYRFSSEVLLLDVAAANTYIAYLITSNRTYSRQADDIGTGNFTIGLNFLADMDAGDTAKIQIVVSGGAGNTVSIYGNPTAVKTVFSGYLVE